MQGGDKVFLQLRGVPVLQYSLSAFSESPGIGAIVLVMSSDNIEQGRALAGRGEFPKVAAIVEGGASRQESARIGLDALPPTVGGKPVDVVLVHDAARPFVTGSLIERGIRAARETGAAVPGLPVRDTVKRVDDSESVLDTPERSSLRAVQTPQVFRRDVLARAYREDSLSFATDDAALVEAIGGRVRVFRGDPENIKITDGSDLPFADLIAARRVGAPPSPEQRWGTGLDSHRLKSGGPLRIGGVDLEFDWHLEGHSDGDVLLHAISSACLGASGLGDLGTHFPSSDPSLKGVDSRVLLQRCVNMASEVGWVAQYLDATIVAQRPRIAPDLERVRLSVAHAVGLSPDNVNLKATSTDELGAIGRSEGIAAQAVMTVARRR